MQSTGFSSAAPQIQEDDPSPAANASSEALRKLLIGSGSDQMNLRAAKERAQALKRSLDEFIEILQFQPHRLTWEDSLERFGVMGVRQQQLAQQIRPLLRFYVAHPKAVNQSNAELIPLLLSTMKLPEMESEEQALMSGGDGAAAAATAAGGGSQDHQAIESALTGFNALIDQLTQHVPGDESSGILDPKGPKRRAMALELRSAVNAAEAPAAAVGPLSIGSEAERALLEAARTGKGL